MGIHELKDQIARLPEQPGVYLYFNTSGDTIYVGKARALRDRVRNYLGAYGGDPKTDALLNEIARLEVIVTDSVVEALDEDFSSEPHATRPSAVVRTVAAITTRLNECVIPCASFFVTGAWRRSRTT